MSIRSIITGIKNIIRWFPVIWQDRDFDFGFVYRILYFKLKNMEEFFRSEDAYTVDAIKTANKIKVAKNLAKRLMEDDYLHNALYFYYKKYGEDAKIFTIGDGGKLIWTDNKQMLNEFKKCGEHSDYMRKQDMDFLFDYLKKYNMHWWD